MANTKKLEVLITGNAKGASKAFGELDKSAGKAEKSTKKAESGLSKLQSGLIGFGAGAAVYAAFSAFDDAQKVMAQTEAVLKSTGGAANVTAGEVESLAGALSKKTGVDDEAIQSGQNLLLTFTGIRNEVGKGNDIFDQATKAALDMSVAMGTDMKSASMTLGKALNDPVAGLAKLTKVGVVFTQQQKDQIASLSESGDKLGAQKIILAELNKEFGGSAEAQATALGKAKVSVDNMAESIGGALAPALEGGAEALGSLADGFSAMPSQVQTTTLLVGAGALAWVKWGDGIRGAAGTAKSGIGALKGAADAIGDIASTRGVSKGTAALEVLKSSMSGLSTAAITGTAAAAGLAAIFVKWQIDAERTKKNIKDLADAIEGGLTPAEATAEKLANTLAGVDGGFENMTGSSEAFREKIRELGLDATDVAKLIKMPADEWEKSQAKFRDGMGNNFIENIDMMRHASEKGAGSAKTLSAVQKELGVTTDDTGEKIGAAGDRSAEAAVSQERNADSLKAIADSAKKATENITSFYDATTQTLASQIDVEAALDDVTQSLKDNGTTLDITTEKGRNNQTAIIAAKDAQVEYAMQLRDKSGSRAAISSMVDYSGKLYDSMIQAGLTKNEAGRLIAQMKLTPKDIYTKFGSNSAEAELRAAAVRRSIQQVPGWKDIHFNALTQSAMQQIAILSRAVNNVGGSVLSGTAGAAIQQSTAAHKRGKATGGPVRTGRINLVGEHGPELVQWGGNGTVIPAPQTKAMLSGGAMVAPVYLTVQVEGSVVTERKLVEVVRGGLIDIGRRTGRPVLAGY